MNPATTETVTLGWLATLAGITDSMVAEQLPSDVTTWTDTGFVTVTGAGGVPDLYFPVAHPIVMLQFWGAQLNTGLPSWNTARNLAEIVRAGCLNNGTGAVVAIPAGGNARVISAYLKSEPRRTWGDVGDYACYTADLAIHWAAS